jgi:uncharacterized protein YecE (DUF72 family)
MELFPPERPPQAERLAPRLRALARQGIYFGTSSWKYDGWLGSIYSPERYETRGKVSKKKFDDTCLTEYAETFPTVCGDFAFYQFPTEEYWQRLFDAAPAPFVFSFKVPEDITVAVWPTHARYGRRAGLPNEHFLNPVPFSLYFTERLRSHAKQVGPLIFEFGTFNKATFPTLNGFLDRLDPFLAALPIGFRYAVEIRNRDYLKPEYFEVLASHNVAHVFNAWTRMPDLGVQRTMPGAFTADFAVVRALLRCGRTYEQAVSTFEPYDSVKDPDVATREALTEIARRAREAGQPAFLFVNNRLEGNAPSTIEAVIEQLDAESAG